MLIINVLIPEEYNEETQEFIPSESVSLELEHSLVSLSKWESYFKKPFLGKEEKTSAETSWYIRTMVLTQKFPPEVFSYLTNENINAINEYIADKMTATWFVEYEKPKPNREVITAEIIYHWMVAMNIPFECQYWHLNRLLTLVRVCNQKNAPQKRMGKKALAQHNREMNAQRRRQLGTSG